MSLPTNWVKTWISFSSKWIKSIRPYTARYNVWMISNKLDTNTKHSSRPCRWSRTYRTRSPDTIDQEHCPSYRGSSKIVYVENSQRHLKGQFCCILENNMTLDQIYIYIYNIYIYIYIWIYVYIYTRGVQLVLSLAILGYIFGRKSAAGLIYWLLLVFSKNFMSSACLFYEMQFIGVSR